MPSSWASTAFRECSSMRMILVDGCSPFSFAHFVKLKRWPSRGLYFNALTKVPFPWIRSRYPSPNKYLDRFPHGDRTHLVLRAELIAGGDEFIVFPLPSLDLRHQVIFDLHIQWGGAATLE